MPRSTHYLARLIVILLLISLSACGFQLRGQATLPLEMAQTAIITESDPNRPPSELAITLSTVLQANGVEVVPATEGVTELLIREESLRRRTLATGPDGEVREYNLELVVRYQLTLPGDEVLINNGEIRLERDILYSEVDVLGRSEGEAIAVNDLITDAAYAIVRRIQAVTKT